MTDEDPLGTALHLLRLTGTFYCRAELTAPWGIARELTPAVLLVGLAAYVLKLGSLGVVLALVESGLPKLRVFRVPDLLGAASLLALLAVVSLFVVGG